MSCQRVWISRRKADFLAKTGPLKSDDFFCVSGGPCTSDDLCYELVPVSKEQLEREHTEAAAGINAINEEVKG